MAGQAKLSQGRQVQCSELRIFRSDRVSADQVYATATTLNLDPRGSSTISNGPPTRPRCAASEYLYYSLVESRSTELP